LTFKAEDFKHPRAPEFFGGQHAPAKCVGCHVRTPLQKAHAVAAAAPPANPPSMECRACHQDVHLGQVDAACDKCHAIDAPKFAAARFSHERVSFALTGKHQLIDCVKCHPKEMRKFPGGTGTAMRLRPMTNECRDCHKDSHLGQVDAQCKTCHTTVSFDIFAFKHRTLSPIFGRLHDTVRCQACHKQETGVFPSGRGIAVRFKIKSACTDCHPF
jgi:Zn finger protein HypA/HybF involved in hydrogenase expression